MKKFFALLLSLAMVLALVACGQKETTTPDDTQTPDDTTPEVDTAGRGGFRGQQCKARFRRGGRYNGELYDQAEAAPRADCSELCF